MHTPDHASEFPVGSARTKSGPDARIAAIRADSHAVLLPAFADLQIDDHIKLFLTGGGKAILLGETRAEYVGRRMSPQRLRDETATMFGRTVQEAIAIAGPLLVAVDQELAGIQRLQGLAPPLPTLEAALLMSDAAIESVCFDIAGAARALGVTMFLAPIADVVDGPNPWLHGRTLGTDPAEVARVASAFVRGVQRGGVIATAKHFPGYRQMAADPALVDVSLTGSAADLAIAGPVFQAVIAAGVKAVMTGPAPVAAIDANQSASTSPAVMALLRQEFGFRGLIVSDDLDAPATLRGRSLLDTAIASLTAGADLLLLASGPHTADIIEGLSAAVADGKLSRDRLADAAARVRSLAAQVSRAALTL